MNGKGKFKGVDGSEYIGEFANDNKVNWVFHYSNYITWFNWSMVASFKYRISSISIFYSYNYCSYVYIIFKLDSIITY